MRGPRQQSTTTPETCPTIVNGLLRPVITQRGLNLRKKCRWSSDCPWSKFCEFQIGCIFRWLAAWSDLSVRCAWSAKIVKLLTRDGAAWFGKDLLLRTPRTETVHWLWEEWNVFAIQELCFSICFACGCCQRWNPEFSCQWSGFWFGRVAMVSTMSVDVYDYVPGTYDS